MQNIILRKKESIKWLRIVKEKLLEAPSLIRQT